MKEIIKDVNGLRYGHGQFREIGFNASENKGCLVNRATGKDITETGEDITLHLIIPPEETLYEVDDNGEKTLRSAAFAYCVINGAPARVGFSGLNAQSLRNLVRGSFYDLPDNIILKIMPEIKDHGKGKGKAWLCGFAIEEAPKDAANLTQWYSHCAFGELVNFGAADIDPLFARLVGKAQAASASDDDVPALPEG